VWAIFRSCSDLAFLRFIISFALGFGITGLYYQYFDGTNEPKVTVDFVDVDTGEIIDEVVYPDSVQDSSSHTDGALTSN
jgi:hypothetical protein